MWRGGRVGGPTSPVVDKNQEGYLGSARPQAQTRPPSPGFQRQEDKPPIPSGCKKQWGFGQQKKLQHSQETPLKGPAMDSGLTQTRPPPLGLSTRATAAYGENVKGLETGECWETASSWASMQGPGSGTVRCLSPPPHRATER